MSARIGMTQNSKKEGIMRIIGITGGVGAGKSEIIKYLQKQYGVEVAIADKIGHLVMGKGEVCYDDIVDLLGSAIIDKDGELNRSKIATIVHADKEKLAQLEAIIHPFVKQCIIKMIIDASKRDEKYFFMEVPLFFEDNYDKISDEVWYVYANCEARCQRLAKSRGYSEEKASQIMSNQLSDIQFREKCDFVIDNSGDFSDTINPINARMQTYETM